MPVWHWNKTPVSSPNVKRKMYTATYSRSLSIKFQSNDNVYFHNHKLYKFQRLSDVFQVCYHFAMWDGFRLNHRHKAITIQNVFTSIHNCVLELFVSCIVQTLGVARFRTVTVRSLVLNTLGSNTSNTILQCHAPGTLKRCQTQCLHSLPLSELVLHCRSEF